MTKISDKGAQNQLKERISAAFNNDCQLSLMTSLVKHGDSITLIPVQMTDMFCSLSAVASSCQKYGRTVICSSQSLSEVIHGFTVEQAEQAEVSQELEEGLWEEKRGEIRGRHYRICDFSNIPSE